MDFVLIVELTFMTDPQLEEEIGLVKGCMDSLRRFHDLFDNAILTETVVPEDEGRLQELRETLPEQWDSVFQRLALRRDECVSAVVETASSLSTVVTLTEFQRRKLYDLWHKAYMKLHFLLGRLEYRKETLEAFRPAALKAKKLLGIGALIIALLLLALAIYIVGR